MNSIRNLLARWLLALGVAALVSLASAPASGATVSCDYDQAADVLNVTAGAAGDIALLGVEGGQITVVDALAGASTCTGGGGPPTQANTSNINLFDAGVSSSWILQDPEDFVHTPTSQEIGIAAALGGGTDAVSIFDADGENDFWTLGSQGLNWNGDMDREIAFLSVEEIAMAGLSGNDALTARGTAGTGDPFAGPGTFAALGGLDDDVIEGGDGADRLEGEGGDDQVNGFGGPDELSGGAATNEVNGGAGEDIASYLGSSAGVTVDLNAAGPQNTGAGIDSLSQIEGLSGSNQADTLIGNGDANQLLGQDGDDRLDGRAGNDELNGGAGTNTATYAQAPSGVSVDLQAGTASGGSGNDTLIGVANLLGSSFVDSLTGDAANNTITGRGGNDTIAAEAGADVVNVRDGGPDTASCGAQIDTATADRASVDAVNADCENVSFLPEPDGGDGGGGVGGGSDDDQLDFDVSGKRKQRIARKRGVIVKVSCPQEACTVTATGTGRVPKPKQGHTPLAKLNLKPVTERVAAGVEEKIKLGIKKRKLRAVKAALRAGKRPKVTVTVDAVDSAGDEATDTLEVRTKR